MMHCDCCAQESDGSAGPCDCIGPQAFEAGAKAALEAVEREIKTREKPRMPKHAGYGNVAYAEGHFHGQKAVVRYAIACVDNVRDDLQKVENES